MDLDQIKEYLSKLDKATFDYKIFENLRELKRDAVKSEKEELANEIWCLEKISDIQKLYIDAYNQVKNKKYFDAWCTYEQIDICFCHLRPHFDYGKNKYNLGFIEEYILKIEKLYPYQYFLSRETVVKKVSCSICGKINTIRNRCGHVAGRLYMGEMCCNEVKDFEFLAEAIVKNPHDKYTVLFPQDMEYDYFALDHLFNRLDSPYDRWILDVEHRIQPKFEKAERNQSCPCGSGKKYKRCCHGTDSETTEHYMITFLDNKNVEPLPYTLVGTWKEKSEKQIDLLS